MAGHNRINPFLPENNGGTAIQHPPLVRADSLPADSESLLRSIQEATTAHDFMGTRFSGGACVTCGGYRAKKEMAPRGPFMLPQPPDRGRIAIEVHTLRFGNPPWMRECAPTLDAWCARHNIPLHVTSQWDRSYPDPKFCEVDMLRAFLAGENEWMVYVDADIVVHPSAPFPIFGDGGFYIREDTHGRSNKRWFAWCQEKFGLTPDPDYLYRNAGVWACDRESAARMLEVIQQPYHEGIMEQDHWNWWISLATSRGMKLRNLGHEWNRFPREIRPSWFFHIYCKAKLKHLLNFRRAGLLPDYVKRLDSPPPVPDFGKGAVVWPWKSSAAEWDELWYSHRSVLRYWSEMDWPLVLLGDQRPAWWPGEFIHAESYEHALHIGVQCAEQVLWMNDDIFMLAPQGPQDFLIAPQLGDMSAVLGETMLSASQWRAGLGQVLMRCHHHRKSTFNFSTHTPYLYQRDKAREVLEVFGNFWKIPFETAYHNWHATPHGPPDAKALNPAQLGGKLWINPSFRQVTPAFIQECASRFGPPPS